MPNRGRGRGRGRGQGKGRGGKGSPKELLIPPELSSPPSPVPGPSTRNVEEQTVKGRERGRGRGRGRGSKRCSKELFPPELSPPLQPVPGPSSRTFEEEKQLLLKRNAETKKRVKNLPGDARNIYVGKKRARQLERFLLPDAPPRKQIRKLSPTRSICRLSDGTPKTPPARKLMSWEVSYREQLNIETTEAREKTPPHNTAQDWDTPTSTVSLDSVVEVPGYSPLRVDWSTGNLRTNATPATPSCSKSSLPSIKQEQTSNQGIKATPTTPSSSKTSLPSTNQEPTLNHGVKPVKVKNKKNITSAEYGTKKADEIFEEWCKELEGESDEEDEECDLPVEPSIDVNLEAAVLPPNLPAEVVAWLDNEDAEADQTIRQMLPIDHLTFDWDCDYKTFKGQREEFTATPGPTFTLDSDTTPLTVFRKFFDDDIMDLIVRQTNKHSNTLIDKITTENSRLLNWKNTDRAELYVFLAMIIFQGLAPLNVEYDYWRENGYLTLKYFKELMTYNRFVLMKRLLQFTSNQTATTGLSRTQRKVYKIWPLFEHLNKKFSSLYIPKQNISIDESLLKWHGRLSIAQKIATKAAKVGVKSYELCESDTGYLWSFFIYAGKGDKIGPNMTNDIDNEQTDVDPDIIDLTELNQMTDSDRQTADSRQPSSASSLPPSPQNATAQIVHHLVKPLLGQGYTLIMDNFYNSPLLARYLKSQKTDCFGTLRVNRELVPESIKGLAKSEMRVGEIAQTFCPDVTIILWRDTNVVSMISTYHQGEVSGKEKYGRYKYKPEIVYEYNLAMGGVDKKDQLLSAHPMERCRNQVWYKKVFRRLLNVTILNAYVIFKTQNPAITSRAFRQRLANELISAYLPPRIQTTLQVGPKYLIKYPGGKTRPIVHGNHFIGQGVSKNIICVWCRQSRTKYVCKQCNISLCLNICFEEYHTKP